MAIHQISKIASAAKENGMVTTFTLDAFFPFAAHGGGKGGKSAGEAAVQAGQFVMLWLPDAGDEKPFSIAGINPLRISVGARGPFSRRLCEMKKGGKVWVRGPYGRGFDFPKGAKRILLVGGGYGFAPLRFLAEQARECGIASVAICGARSKSLLMKPACCKTIFTTDDGSSGTKGNVLVAMEERLKAEKFDAVYSCGPERMMGAVARLAKKHKVKECQLLLERYMKCGIGVCGHCTCGDRLVCFDGPRFGYEILDNPEFEKFGRDRAGRQHPL